MAKTGLGPLESGAGPKGLTQVTGRRPASGQSLVDLADPENDFQAVAGEARTRTNRLTHSLNEAANKHGEVPFVTSKVWTPHSNVVSPDSLPNRGDVKVQGIPVGPLKGPASAANPAGRGRSSKEE